MELSIAGMVDGPESSPFTSQERMARLKDYVSAWEALQFQDPETIKVREPCIWNMTGGLLSYGTFDTGHGNGSATTTNLVFRKLASRTRCIEGRVWSYDVPRKVYLMDTDLYQDLLILVTMDPTIEAQCAIMHISLHQLSTGEAHPKAHRPLIDHEVAYEIVEPNRCFISTCRNYVAILCYKMVNSDDDQSDVHVSDAMFCIYDWESGDLAWCIKDSIRSFTFISESHVLLALLPNSKDSPCAGVLAVVNFIDQHRLSCYSVTTALLLPILATNSVAYDISVRSSPPPGVVGPSAAFPDPIPFSTAHDSRLITVNLHLHQSKQFLFCIPLSTIRRFMGGEAQVVTRLIDCVEQGLPWESWGPDGSQMTWRVGQPAVCYSWGNRCSVERTGQVWRSRFPICCDFNPLLFKQHLRDIQTNGELENSSVLIDNANTNGTGIFQGDMSTSLPCMMKRMPGLFLFGVVMLNEDHLVRLTASVDNDGDIQRFDIYQIS
ncbi:hypothetical protein BD410DRAFT_308627 [Rickenella mellea]|uniref:Uncharacterized protein n=1 Tax=Rickenella mellea TaxID=50990 RepID=A0A4Y7Q359_9AGAM|nr:hypothetical protein BD410DRAFT_308627 [Rickenella mellea]